MLSCTIVNFQILSSFLDRKALFLESLYQLLPFIDFNWDVAALCTRLIFISRLIQSFLIERSAMSGWISQDHVNKLLVLNSLHEYLLMIKITWVTGKSFANFNIIKDNQTLHRLIVILTLYIHDCINHEVTETTYSRFPMVSMNANIHIKREAFTGWCSGSCMLRQPKTRASQGDLFVRHRSIACW